MFVKTSKSGIFISRTNGNAISRYTNKCIHVLGKYGILLFSPVTWFTTSATLLLLIFFIEIKLYTPVITSEEIMMFCEIAAKVFA